MGRDGAGLRAGPIAAALLGSIGQAAAQLPFPVEAPAQDGATLFRNQCATCHSVRPADAPRQGPNLAGVVGRKVGTQPGFKYSKGFAAADFVWDDAQLNAYLANPQQVIPGSIMAYRQADPKVRGTIIAWLKEQH